MARPRKQPAAPAASAESKPKPVQAPKGPKYDFHLAQVRIAMAEPLQITGTRKLRGFDPDDLKLTLHIACSAMMDGELEHFVDLQPIELPASDINRWVEEDLPGVLLKGAQDYEEMERNGLVNNPEPGQALPLPPVEPEDGC